MPYPQVLITFLVNTSTHPAVLHLLKATVLFKLKLLVRKSDFKYLPLDLADPGGKKKRKGKKRKGRCCQKLLINKSNLSLYSQVLVARCLRKSWVLHWKDSENWGTERLWQQRMLMALPPANACSGAQVPASKMSSAIPWRWKMVSKKKQRQHPGWLEMCTAVVGICGAFAYKRSYLMKAQTSLLHEPHSRVCWAPMPGPSPCTHD